MIALVAWGAASMAWAAPGDASNDERDRARRAFADGQRLYDAGQFDEAIDKFREADRLQPSPRLQFNMAQAYRKKGACREALAAYRAFLRDMPDPRADLRARAEQHIGELDRECGAASSPPMPPAASPSPPVSEAPTTSLSLQPAQAPEKPLAALQVTGGPGKSAPPARASSSMMVPALFIAGASLLIVSGGALLWSEHEHGLWSEEDAKLRELKMQTGGVSPQEIARQNANDQRLNRVERLDAIAIGTGLAGAVALLTAGSVSVVRAFKARPIPNGGIALSFSLSY